MKVTLIGGSGFVGTRLAERLLASGHEVKIADKKDSRKYPELRVYCDVREPETLLRELAGSDVVVNLAAEHRDDVTPRSLYDDVNVKGAANVRDACSALGIRKLVFTSSVAVYGFAPAGTDETGEINYFNDYGRTKWLAEQEYRKWLTPGSGNSLVIVRPTVIFGEQNRGNVYNLLSHIAAGRFPMVGKGTNHKSMNYVENVAAFLEYELSRDDDPGEHLYNYCDEPAYDMNHLVMDVYAALGRPRKRLFHWPYWMAYCGGLCFDLAAFLTRRKFSISSIRVKKFTQDTYFVGAAVRKTGFVAPVSLREGLKRTIDYEFVRQVKGHVFVTE